MRKINLSISGCMGRMGQQLIKSSKKNRNFKLVSLTENRIINKKIFGIKPSRNNFEAFKKSNVIIDFTVPKCTLEILKIASKLKKRVVIGTTGFSKKEENIIKKFSKKIPIPLNYRNTFTLLISVLLSAQCTDVNVNNVTKDIYPKYNKPEHFVKLGRQKIERLIKRIGIFRVKAKSIFVIKWNGNFWIFFI